MSELLVIKEDGRHAWIPNEYEEIRAAVGNWIDLCAGYGPVSAFVDDEGMLNGRQLNVVGSIALGRPVFGPAVLCALRPDDEGNTLPPPRNAADAFVELANIWRSVRMGAERLGQDLTITANASTLPGPQLIQMTKDEFEKWLESGIPPHE